MTCLQPSTHLKYEKELFLSYPPLTLFLFFDKPGTAHVSLIKSHVAPTKHPGLTQHGIVRYAPMKRWHRQPGSIFDYDPSEYETEHEYESGLGYSTLSSSSLHCLNSFIPLS